MREALLNDAEPIRLVGAATNPFTMKASNEDSVRRILRAQISPDVFPAIVVAVPARNEADKIGACLDALAVQETTRGASLIGRIGVVCLINDTSDATFEIACTEAARLSLPVRLFDVAMPRRAANAGGARRAAMDLAAKWLEEGCHKDGLLFTTDADSLPQPDWVFAAQCAFSRDADCVAGPIDLYADDVLSLPLHVRERGALEARYDALLTELFARLDPRPHDPWPRHAQEAGANLAVTLRAYRAIGGLPDIACGEDRALCAALEHHGLRVRHDFGPRVGTSGRLDGRAEGGVADTLRLRCQQSDAVCDGYLEPALNAQFRGAWRGRLRKAFTKGDIIAALKAFDGRDHLIAESESFHKIWTTLEKSDPRLVRRLLRPADLLVQIALAEAIVQRLREDGDLIETTETEDGEVNTSVLLPQHALVHDAVADHIIGG